MDWRTYEIEIYQHLCSLYPDAAIRRDVQLPGRDSNVDRQIDILIEDEIAGFRSRIVVDGKYFARPINVTHVERFIGLVEDVRATHGLMVTPRGYSKAALRRAQNHSKDIQLDVLNLSELREYQSLAAIPYAGNRGMYVNAPFGWIVDGSRNDEFSATATLYQRGRTLEEAMRLHDWMYVNYWRKDAEASSLPEVLEMQTREMAEATMRAATRAAARAAERGERPSRSKAGRKSSKANRATRSGPTERSREFSRTASIVEQALDEQVMERAAAGRRGRGVRPRPVGQTGARGVRGRGSQRRG